MLYLNVNGYFIDYDGSLTLFYTTNYSYGEISTLVVNDFQYENIIESSNTINLGNNLKLCSFSKIKLNNQDYNNDLILKLYVGDLYQITTIKPKKPNSIKILVGETPYKLIGKQLTISGITNAINGEKITVLIVNESKIQESYYTVANNGKWLVETKKDYANGKYSLFAIVEDGGSDAIEVEVYNPSQFIIFSKKFFNSNGSNLLIDGFTDYKSNEVYVDIYNQDNQSIFRLITNNINHTNGYWSMSVSQTIPEGKHSIVSQIKDSSDSSFISSQKSFLTIDKSPPNPVSGLIISDYHPNGVKISWEIDSNDIVSYKVYKDNTLIGTTHNNEFVINNLVLQQEYSIDIEVVDSVENYSQKSNIKVKLLDSDPPTPPLNLTANNITKNSFTVDWIPSFDNSKIVSHYVVYLNEQEIGNTSSTTYSFSNLQVATTYTIKIKAVDNLNQKSKFSAPLTITTQDSGSYSDLRILVKKLLSQEMIQFNVQKGVITINNLDISIVEKIKIDGFGSIDVVGNPETSTISISSPSIVAGEGVSIETSNDGLIKTIVSTKIGGKEVDNGGITNATNGNYFLTYKINSPTNAKFEYKSVDDFVDLIVNSIEAKLPKWRTKYEINPTLVNGINDQFDLIDKIKLGTEHIYVNGVLQDEGISGDYVVNNDGLKSKLIFHNPPNENYKVVATYQY